MRENKFRAWDKRFKKMDYGGGDLLLRINGDDFSEPMQYTGLKDKNGKEIYFESIIRANYYSPICLDSEPQVVTGVVTESEMGTYYLDLGYVSLPLEEFMQDDDFEEVGNIYENPELLKT